jgi:hypothetical protein
MAAPLKKMKLSDGAAVSTSGQRERMVAKPAAVVQKYAIKDCNRLPND